jgi:hypothetical protein
MPLVEDEAASETYHSLENFYFEGVWKIAENKCYYEWLVQLFPPQ